MPDADLKTISGTIITLFPKVRLIAITGQPGCENELIKWDPSQDKQFVRLREGWQTKLTLEKRGKDWVAIAQEAIPRPKEKKNEILPAQLVLLKKWTDLYIACNPPDGLNFRHARGVILATVRDDMRKLLRDADPESVPPWNEMCPVCGSDDTYARDNWDDEQGTNTVQFLCDSCRASWCREEKTSDPIMVFDGEGDPVPGPYDDELFERWPGVPA